MKKSEAGFTLIEIMVAVAVIGLLARLVIPQFTSQSRKAEADTEVSAFFAELSSKEEAYKTDNGSYFSTGASEAATWPTTPKPTQQSVTPLPATWTTLRVQAPQSQVRCGYVVIAGVKGGVAGAMATGTFGFVVPSLSWYYVLAHCDLDGNTATDSYYFASSVDSTIKKINYGR